MHKKILILTPVLILVVALLSITAWQGRVFASGIQALATLFVGTTPVVGGSNGDCLTISTGKLGSGVCGSGGLQSATVNLTEMDLLALDTTPFTVVPAQGANTVVFPFAIRWRVHGGTHPWISTEDSAGSYLWWEGVNNAFGYISSSLANIVNVLAFAGPGGSGTSTTPFPDAAYFVSGLGAYPTAQFTPGQGLFGTDPALYANQPIVIQGLQSLDNGPILSVAVGSMPGMAYVFGDEVTLNAGNFTSDCVFTITGVMGGAVTSIANTTSGTLCPGGMDLSAVTIGNVTSATVTGGNAGLLYVNGDTGTITCPDSGDATAVYTVTAVGGGGAVTAVSTSGGAAYSNDPACTTTPTSGSGNGALQLDVVAGSGSGLTINTTAQHGDGTLTVTIWYTVAPL